MNKGVPISKCVKCCHFNGHICTLEDLEPCQFKRTPEAERERAKNIYFAIVVVIALASSVLFWYLER